MSRLALLIPARNASPFLGRLLASAAAQTRAFDEIRVFDDASDDDTAGLARRHGAIVHRSDVRCGPSAGKNQLASETSCDWVHFHDADDALEPEFVSRAKAWIDGDAADVVLFATEDKTEGTGQSQAIRTWDDAALAADPISFAIEQTITNCGIYRRSAFLYAGGFATSLEFQYSEDQAMHLGLALAGLRFRSDSYPGVVIYRRGGSMSSGHPVACARSQVEVLKHAAAQTGRRYPDVIGARAWLLAGVCAGYSDWTYVRECLRLARRVGYRVPSRQHWLVRAVATVAPEAAVVGREALIRAFKPALRRGFPSVRDEQLPAAPQDSPGA
jgi:glycosyltransferase involved in cell wall biosynthesis